MSGRAPGGAGGDFEAVLASLRSIAARHLEITGELDPGASLTEDLGLDSIQLLTLATEVEDRWQIVLEPEDEAAIETVGDLARTVQRRLREGAVDPGRP